MRSVLKYSFAKNGYQQKENIQAKLEGYMYWPNQFENDFKYIAEYIKYIRYRLVVRSQLLYLAYIIYLMQLLGMDEIKLLLGIESGIVYNFDALSDFDQNFFAFASQIVNNINIICF